MNKLDRGTYERHRRINDLRSAAMRAIATVTVATCFSFWPAAVARCTRNNQSINLFVKQTQGIFHNRTC